MEALTIAATTVGGGSAAAGSVILASAAASTLAGVDAARQQRRAGAIQEAEANIAAKAEGDAAKGREIERKRMLLRAISSQVARAGATGVAMEGSPAALVQLDIDEANRDLLVDRSNTLSRQSGLRSQGRAARVIGRAQARGSLLDTASRTGTMIAGRL